MSETPTDYHAQTFSLAGADPPEDDLADILARIGVDDGAAADYRVKVYRVSKEGMKWLFDMEPTDAAVMERLRDEYEGGLFEVRIYHGTKIFKRPRVNIEAPKRPPKSEALSGADIVGMMRELQAQNLSQMRELIANHSRPEPAAPLDAAAVQRETINLMVSLKELFAPQPLVPQDPIEQLLRLKELERELDVGNGGDKSLVQELTPLLQPLLENLQSHQNSPRRRPQTAMTGPGQAPSAAAAPVSGAQPFIPAYQPPPQAPEPPTPQTEPPMNEPPLNELQTGLSQLCMAAMLRLSAEKAAANLAANASDEQYELLADLVEQDDCLERLVAVYAPVAPHRAWFEGLRAALIEIFEQADENGDEGFDPQTPAELTDDQPRAISEGRGSTREEEDHAYVAERELAAPASHARHPAKR